MVERVPTINFTVLRTSGQFSHDRAKFLNIEDQSSDQQQSAPHRSEAETTMFCIILIDFSSGFWGVDVCSPVTENILQFIL